MTCKDCNKEISEQHRTNTADSDINIYNFCMCNIETFDSSSSAQ